jgi:hypothetical protein
MPADYEEGGRPRILIVVNALASGLRYAHQVYERQALWAIPIAMVAPGLAGR